MKKKKKILSRWGTPIAFQWASVDPQHKVNASTLPLPNSSAKTGAEAAEPSNHEFNSLINDQHLLCKLWQLWCDENTRNTRGSGLVPAYWCSSLPLFLFSAIRCFFLLYINTWITFSYLDCLNRNRIISNNYLTKTKC